MLSMRQHLTEDWVLLSDNSLEGFFDMPGIWEPLVVSTQAEYDYLLAMQLMHGVEMRILLDGRDVVPKNMPPTYIKIDIPL